MSCTLVLESTSTVKVATGHMCEHAKCAWSESNVPQGEIHAESLSLSNVKVKLNKLSFIVTT